MSLTPIERIPTGRVPSERHAPGDEPLVISCDSCVMRATSACEDCVVTFICDRHARDAVVVDVEELRAMRLMADAGLVPRLRLQLR